MKNIMKKHKNKLMIIGIYLLIILVFSTLNLLFLSTNITRFMSMICNLTILFVICFKKGKPRNNKGYIEGLKIGFITIIIFSVINLLFIKNTYTFPVIIYYLIIVLICLFGSVIGINKKAN